MAFVPAAIAAVSAIASVGGPVAAAGFVGGELISAAAPFALAAGVGLAGSSLLNKPKAPSVPSLPSAPNPADSLASAQQSAADRSRLIASSGGNVNVAGMGNTSIDPSQLQRKSLLGQ